MISPTQPASQVVNEKYRLEIEEWRRRREAALRMPDGWLSLAGLFPLQEDIYSLGSDEQSRILLPPSAPATLGTLVFAQGKGMLHVTPEAPVWVDGAPLADGITEVALVDNRDGQRPTIVSVGSVSFNLHKFGNEIAVRVRDTLSPAIADFAGCRWYEIQEAYRVQGHLTRLAAPVPIAVVTSVRSQAEYQNIGVIDFELQGRALRLLAAASKADEVFIIFRDKTAGQETYGAGRYLYAEVDAVGAVTLDFNKAYNPPCAFTPYATCSLPPSENVLPVAIEAGELY